MQYSPCQNFQPVVISKLFASSNCYAIKKDKDVEKTKKQMGNRIKRSVDANHSGIFNYRKLLIVGEKTYFPLVGHR